NEDRLATPQRGGLPGRAAEPSGAALSGRSPLDTGESRHERAFGPLHRSGGVPHCCPAESRPGTPSARVNSVQRRARIHIGEPGKQPPANSPLLDRRLDKENVKSGALELKNVPRAHLSTPVLSPRATALSPRDAVLPLIYPRDRSSQSG